MDYQKQIDRANPSCILFLIDQSGSMSEPFGGQQGRSKAERLADAINRLLAELVIRSTRDQTEGARHYYDVGVLGYGANVGPALGGTLEKRMLVPIQEIALNPLRVESRRRRVEDGAGGTVEEAVKFSVWFDPVSDNGTPMCDALRLATSVLGPWVKDHPDSFPPIVINITDGEPDPGCDPRQPAEEVRRLSTSDGNVLLFNVHLSSQPGSPILYVDNNASLPDEFARQLFEMSSQLPPHIRDAARGEGYPVGESSRGFVFNADIVEVIKFLNIGTMPKYLR